jgi:hypothetical protein
VEAARGEYLCMQDADDVSMPHRVEQQLALAAADRNAIVGGGFERVPAGSTSAYTEWANGLSDVDAVAQQWRECTLLQPTWFMHRNVFERVGGYDEVHPVLLAPEAAGRPPAAAGSRHVKADSDRGGRSAAPASDATPSHGAASGADAVAASSTPVTPGVAVDAAAAAAAALCTVPMTPVSAAQYAWPHRQCGVRHPPILGRGPLRIARENLEAHSFSVFPEDTILLQRHLAAGGSLRRVPTPVITYTYSPGSLSWRVPRGVLLAVRVAMFEERVLSQREWRTFTIWGAGRDGKVCAGGTEARGGGSGAPTT